MSPCFRSTPALKPRWHALHETGSRWTHGASGSSWMVGETGASDAESATDVVLDVVDSLLRLFGSLFTAPKSARSGKHASQMRMDVHQRSRHGWVNVRVDTGGMIALRIVDEDGVGRRRRIGNVLVFEERKLVKSLVSARLTK